MKLKKLISIIFVLLLSVGVLSSPVSAVEIVEDKGVVIGFDDTYAPFGFKDENGEYTGFDVDLAKAVFEKLGVKYKFQPIEWAMKETELATGQIDMIWSGYTRTPEREKEYLFSDTYLEGKRLILVQSDSDINTKADLEGKTIATQEGSSELDAINADTELVNSIAGGQAVTYPSFTEVLSDLANGRVDAIVIEDSLLGYYYKQNNQTEKFKALDETLGDKKLAVGFRKEDEDFVSKFNEVLKEVKEDGTYDKIKEKWFGNID